MVIRNLKHKVSFIIDYIERLQAKPKHVRVRVMWLAVFVCMLVIFVAWAISLKSTLKKGAEAPVIPQEVTDSVNQLKEQAPTTKDLNAGIKSLFEQNKTENSPFEKN